MRTRLTVVVLALLVAVAAGCGGGSKKTTFTNANWGDIEFNAQTGKYNGSPVDIVAQVYFVAETERDAIWFMVYADAAQENFRTLVEVPDGSFKVEQNDFVHIVGTIEQNTELPSMVMWDTGPVVVASKATVVPQPSG
jgi:hypothetical protein